MSLAGFALAFVAGLGFLVLAIGKGKIHPFLALLVLSLCLALLAGLPLLDTATDSGPLPGVLSVIREGFAGTLRDIGLVIIFGTLIGAILELSGAALRIAEVVLKLVGPAYPELAALLTGWIVSMAVFCDSAFVLLNPVRKAMVRRSGHSSVAITTCLSSGLFTSHNLIPPAAGPIAAAAALGVSGQLPLLFLLGVLVSLPALGLVYLFSLYQGKKMCVAEDEPQNHAEDASQRIPDCEPESGHERANDVPSAFLSFLPLILPLLLMSLGAFVRLAKAPATMGRSPFILELLSFLSQPEMALAVGLLAAFVLTLSCGRRRELGELTEKGLSTAGPILCITAAGGALGHVIVASGVAERLAQCAQTFSGLGLCFPFLLAALLKTAQGSSTVALVTTAGMVQSLLPALGLDSPQLRCLTVLAIGAGAMTVTHANDSYFWVIARLGGLSTGKAARTVTLASLLEGLAALATVLLLSLVLV